MLSISVLCAGNAEHSSDDETSCTAGRYLEKAQQCVHADESGCYTALLGEVRASLNSAVPVKIEIINHSEEIFYLEAFPLTEQFKYSLHAVGQVEEMHILKSQFCPTMCPAHGPVLEVDCGAPPPRILQLLPGAKLDSHWLGTVLVPSVRACEGLTEKFCLTETISPAGDYLVKVCGTRNYEPSVRSYSSSNESLHGALVGKPVCLEAPFTYPTTQFISFTMSL